ncbi:hypothetical protein SK128_015596 [Halocaridina rubra]|uniref:Uncharacterized protein n=1 Tax=Halocaridina rubra TaxID=373956 RepID=A0AAN9A5Q0_HALRR
MDGWINVCRRSPIVPAQPIMSGDEILSASMSGNFRALNGILPGSRGNRSHGPSSFRSRSLPSSSPSSQVWVNPLNDTSRGKHDMATAGGSAPGSSGGGRDRSSPNRPHRLPDSINKELEKRRIGKSLNDLTISGSNGGERYSGGRRNSWENGQDVNTLPNVKKNPKGKNMSPGSKSGLRAKARSQSVPRPKVRGKTDAAKGHAPGGGPDRRPQDPSYHDSSPLEVNNVPVPDPAEPVTA